MENPGKVPKVLLEVQTGSYLDDDDIIRYEDVYARGQGIGIATPPLGTKLERAEMFSAPGRRYSCQI